MNLPTTKLNIQFVYRFLAMASNFDKNDKHVADYQDTPYDYSSIMQYGKTAFKKPSISGKQTH